MSAFTKIQTAKPPRSVFNLSYEKKFDCDMGELVPICLEEMVPGDTFRVSNEIVIRFQPLVAPILHEVNAYVHYFFVPTRLIFDGWEGFITGGEDGNDTTVLPRFAYDSGEYTAQQAVGPYSLYDYFGFPVMQDSNNAYTFPGNGITLGNDGYNYRPLSFPWAVYNIVWNEYYRDETLQDEVALDQPLVLHRNWSKDYFTSALPWQQRGTAPALPVDVSFNFNNSDVYGLTQSDAVSISGTSPVLISSTAGDTVASQLYSPDVPTVQVGIYGSNDAHSSTSLNKYYPVFVDGSSLAGNLSDNSRRIGVPVGWSSVITSNWNSAIDATTFDVSDLRLAFQVQKWMERNARSGVRYTSFLHAHFAVSPRDDRLQRPEYLGGSKSPILVSEVVQTSESGTTPQGTLKGKALTADRNFVCSYTAKEFGYLIGIMSVMPKPSYQQGVDRKWLRSSRFDFYFPEFSTLSEQSLTTEEVYALPGNDTESDISNGTIFGYQARYNEMRMNQNKVCGSLRDTLDYWHLGRIFDTVPQLNSEFIECDATNDDLKRIFAVQNVPGMIVNFANIITAIRPIPKFGEPGLIDHH